MQNKAIKRFYREVRCSNCRTLLAEEYVYNGRLRIKCYRCNNIDELNFKSTKKLLKKLVDLEEVENNLSKNL